MCERERVSEREERECALTRANDGMLTMFRQSEGERSISFETARILGIPAS